MIYNPIDKFYKSYTGAVPENMEVTFRVKGNFDSVAFAFKKDGEESFTFYSMNNCGDYFEITTSFSVGLYFYFFKINENQFISENTDGFGDIMSNIIAFQLTAFSESFKTPSWFKGKIMYQIFPDRFCRKIKEKNIGENKTLHENWMDNPVLEYDNKKILNNDFFGGDFLGIKSKLEYLSELGVGVIYLNPIFKSFSNHRYDTGNYFEIDPILGSEEDLIDLINEAEKFDIKIVLDGVFNHTGDDSVYFNKYGNYDSLGAYQSEKSPYFSWYDFRSYPDDYNSWWGVPTLPSIKTNSKEFIEFIAGKDGVIEKYTTLGIGGWRLDVVDELSSDFVKKIRSCAKNIDNNAIVIGEVWEDASNKISYGNRREYFQGKELDSVMNYPLKDAILFFVNNGDSKVLSKIVREQIDHYPAIVLHSLMNILSTHDTARLLNSLSGVDIKGKEKRELELINIEFDLDLLFKLKCATLLQYTLCGVPCIYYGDEAGLDGWFDPLNRKTFPWGQENKEIISWYKKLGQIRNSVSAFSDGDLIEVYSEKGLYAFKRIDEESQVLVVVNVGKERFELDFEGELFNLLDEKSYKEKIEITSRFIGVFIKQ